jgi:spore maturation protein CgeB
LSDPLAPPETRVLFVAYDAEGHVGQHLIEAATKLRVHHRVMSPASAFDASWLVSKINWHVRGHRPTKLEQFGERAVEVCRAIQATHLVATGIAPLPASAVRALRNAGLRVVNWLTDDPWNEAHKAPWFIDTIPEYDVIFTPRSAIIDDLRAAGARAVEMMPFAYCSNCHFGTPKRGREQRSVVSFVGGADKDRAKYMNTLVKHKIPIELYGGYWKEDRGLKQFAAGFVDMETYRTVASGTAVCLCLVREANRDGHVMRSYELAAMRACILAQDTPDHRELYGADGETVRYFTNTEDISDVARQLLANPAERERLAVAVHSRVARPENNYYARLEQLIG